jgi:hypothetical protein
MIRIGRPVVYLSVLLTFLATGGRVWPRACEDRYASACEGAPGSPSEPGATARDPATPVTQQPGAVRQEDARRPHAPLELRRQRPRSPDSDELVSTQKRQRPVRADGKTLLQMRQQFEQFMSERALQSGADAPNDRPEDKEKLFRQFERWRRERFSS